MAVKNDRRSFIMKNQNILWLPALCLLSIVTACASNAKTAPSTAVTIQSVEEDPSDDVIIDWLGRNIGAQRPE
jgi:hypothetical protein